MRVAFAHEREPAFGGLQPPQHVDVVGFRRCATRVTRLVALGSSRDERDACLLQPTPGVGVEVLERVVRVPFAFARTRDSVSMTTATRLRLARRAPSAVRRLRSVSSGGIDGSR